MKLKNLTGANRANGVKILCSLCVLLFNSAVFASSVSFYFQDGAGNPVTNTKCVLLPINAPFLTGNGVTASASFNFTTDNNGNAAITNLQSGLYKGRLESLPPTYFELLCPNDTNSYNFLSLLTNLATMPPFTGLVPAVISIPTNVQSCLTLTTNGGTLLWTMAVNTNTLTDPAQFVAATNGVATNFVATNALVISGGRNTATLTLVGNSMGGTSQTIQSTTAGLSVGAAQISSTTFYHINGQFYGNLNVGSNLAVTGSSSLDNGNITSDGSGNLTASSFNGKGGGLTGILSGNITISPWLYTNFSTTSFAKYYTNTWGRNVTIYWSFASLNSAAYANAAYLFDTNAVNASFIAPPLYLFGAKVTGTNYFKFDLPPGGYFSVTNWDSGASTPYTNFVQLH